MSEESPNPNETHFGVIASSSCLVVLGLISLYSPRAAVGLSLVLVPLFIFAFLVLSNIDQRKRARRSRRLEIRRNLVKRKQIQNLQSQHEKPGFEKRLNRFVKKKPSRIDLDERVNARMEFWERGETYERLPTRPVELLRQLLQRIAKLVGRN